MKYNSLRLTLMISLGCTHALLVGPMRGARTWRHEFVSSTATLHNAKKNNADADDDLFDPLLSPHAYPNGVDAGPVTERASFTTKHRKAFGFRTNEDDAERMSKTALNIPQQQPEVFDPTLSPHRYPKGTPDQVDLAAATTIPTVKIGILLMDHGSRNPNSNQRLHDLAQLYQSRFSCETTIVRAAHMEIAEPSIPQVLRQLVLEDQVDQVVCHPYFLSPGRHVTQDIPQIMQQAMEDLRKEVTTRELPPIVTTDPVGAQTDVMIAAIHNLVQQSAAVPLSR